MGINIGAFICNFFGAALQIAYGWGAAFFAAGIGMFLGVIIFVIGTRHYKAFDVKKGVAENDMSMTRIVMMILFPSILAGLIGWFIPGNLVGSDSTDAFLFACVPVIYFYTSLYFRAKADEKRPIAALLAIFAVVVLFWAVFKQNGSALTTWADRYTDRSISGTTGTVFRALNLADTLAYKMDSVPMYDDQFRLQKEGGVVMKEYNYPTYFRNIPEKERPTDGNEISLWATNLSQSINPGWVIILTPLIVAFFTFLRRRNREPSTATKIAFGLFISALSALVMVGAVYANNNGGEKASVLWLISSYGVITIGELLLSPMGLSLVSKLSPVRITSLMMGGWFLSTSIGNKLSGVLSGMWDQYTNKGNFFFLNFILLIAAAIVCFMMLKWLNRIMKEKGVS
jgi:POT family proton-dependent oligopeptide transporter